MAEQKRKYNKKSDYWNNNNRKTLQKSTLQKATLSPAKEVAKETRLALTPEIGSVGLNSIKQFSNFLAPHETRFPYCLRTYREMAEDPDVATALDATYIFVDRAFFDFKIKYNVKSNKSKKAAKLVEYNLRNMEAPLRQYVRSLITYKQYGFAFAEKVYERDTDPRSPYYDTIRLKKLAFRPQETIDPVKPFVFSQDGRDILAVNQQITSAMSGGTGLIPTNLLGQKEIPINKLVFVGHNITDNNPLGVSPLLAVYKTWREKTLIEEYEVIGVSKDLGGLPVLLVPADILNRASLNPNGEEAQSIAVLQQNLANLHAGEQAYMVLPSDVFESTSMRMYDVSFQGVQGSGKNFDTQALIKQRKLDIFNRFGAGSLISGDSSGDDKDTLLSYFIERDVDIICEAICAQVIPQLLRINGIFLSDEDMPKFVSGNIDDANIEVNAKAIQQLVATGALPMVPEVINEFLEMCGFNYRIPDDIVASPEKFKEFMAQFGKESTSRSGDGAAAGGLNGTSTEPAARDNSAANLAN